MEDNKNEKRQGSASEGFSAPVEDLARAGKEYVDLKVDEVKLAAVEGLSVGLGRFLSGLLIVCLVMFCCLVLTVTGVLFFGELIGSYALAAAIASLIFIVLTVIVFIRRKSLFVNGFVGLFSNIFFGNENN